VKFFKGNLIMIEKDTNNKIRNIAEEKLALQNIKQSENPENFSLYETKKIIHELEVHQIELKMQNEELLLIQNELEESKKRYFNLYNMAPVGYCSLDKDGFIKEANLAISKLLGKEQHKLIKQSLTKFIFPQDQDIYYLYRKRIFTSQIKQDCEIRMLNENKTIFWANMTALVELNVNKKPTYHLVISDISERKIFENKLKLSASVFKNAGEAIMITNLNGIISDVNETFTKITGYSKKEVVGKKTNILNSGRQNKEYYKKMWEILNNIGSWTGELCDKKKNGESFVGILIINAVYDHQGNPSHFVALLSDITNIKEYENSLKNIAHFDQLTKLPNRVLLADRIENKMIHTKRHKQHLAVIFLDLDEFKEINDTYGHNVGDKVLIHLAKEMREALREVDTLARIGGDEFVAVLSELNEISDALPIILRLLEAASKEIIIDNIKIKVSASLGVTFYPQNQNINADLLLRQADQAMYQSKLSGKNRYHFFNTEENNLIRDRFESIREISLALENKEFILYYQPKVNLRTGEIIGVEALIRWEHPKKGILAPLKFLPIIEDDALSIDVGEWVINTALSQIKAWQEEGLNISISVNVGAHQLLDNNFVNKLKNILSLYPTVNPNMLELEVLETSRLEDLVKVKDVMNTCIKLGVTFSLDDFGTGYSSLIYLKQLPIRQIKIDQNFVHGMIHNQNDLSIVEGIITLCKAFHLNVIAEGIETSEHIAILLELGCEFGQGYKIAHPMSPKVISKWIKEY
jgi:diguanylate cyclase (GGDEF)-like protein/PAS domain S-box-containing protein